MIRHPTSAARPAVLCSLSLILASCGINSVPAKEEIVKARWANVESAYQRRADLIPSLVGVVDAASESERELMIRVAELRADSDTSSSN